MRCKAGQVKERIKSASARDALRGGEARMAGAQAGRHQVSADGVAFADSRTESFGALSVTRNWNLTGLP